MATFQVRIEDLIGSVGDTAAMSDWLTVGAREIADKLDPDRILLYATDKTDADGSTGISLAGGRPVSAHKSGYPALRITRGERALAVDSDSIHYAVSTRPMWYVDVQKGYVLPGGGIVKWFGYPTVAFGDSTITSYPSEALGALVLYAAIQGEMRIISDLINTTMAAVSFTSPTAPTTAGAPSFTYTSPTSAVSYTNIETALTDKDPELAGAEGGELALQLQEYSADIQDAVSAYNEAVAEYQGTLEKFNADLASYSAQVNKQVGEIQATISQYVSMYRGYFELLKSLKEEYSRALETL